MSKSLRRLLIVLGVLLALVLILGGVWLWFSRRAFPKTNGTVRLEGLSAPVDIYRDSYGVPHIYAQTSEDLFFAQGYVHAQERFWQMEFQRRTGAGRLSEVFGETTLSVDRWLRTFDFYALAEGAYAQVSPESKLALDSYAAGVNAYISDRRPAELGLEFAFLELQGVDYAIEPWQPADSLVWAEMMVYDQSDELSTELRNLDRLMAVGAEMAAELNPAYRSDRPVVVSDAELAEFMDLDETSTSWLNEFNNDELAALAALSTGAQDNPVQDQLAQLGLTSEPGGASNAWAISGDLTTTGMPLLAGDPHMGINLPNLWYEVRLSCIELNDDCQYDLRGFSLPGLPALLIGHNNRIAWSLTNGAYDVEDVYIERLNPENPNQYEVNGEWVDMELRREEIFVRGWDEPDILIARWTRHGPIVTDEHMLSARSSFTTTEDGPQLLALSYRWTGNEVKNSGDAIFQLNRAQNFEEFRAALTRFEVGKQSFIYADVDGNIGYQLGGLIPIRAQGNGTLPVPGWTDDYEWVGFIPFEEMPYAYNPAEGFLEMANHQVASDTYPYFLGWDMSRGQRGQRIIDMITSDPDGITVEDMAAMQGDNLSLPALEMRPYLEDLSFDDPAVSAAHELWMAWDARYDMDSPGAVLDAYFNQALMRETFYDQLPQNTWPSHYHRDADAIYFLLQDETNIWWDNVETAETETRDDILATAFESGYWAAVDSLGENMENWAWGDIHTVTFENATLGRSGIGIIENIFNLDPVGEGGGEAIVNRSCWNATEGFEVTCISALRMVVDLGDLSNSLMIHATGQSGHPGHRHYADFLDVWRKVEYHPSNWARADAEADSREHLVLEPAP